MKLLTEKESVLVDDEHVVDGPPVGEGHVAGALHGVRDDGPHVLGDHSDLPLLQRGLLRLGEPGEVLRLVLELDHIDLLDVLELLLGVDAVDVLLESNIRRTEDIARDLDVPLHCEGLLGVVSSYPHLAHVVNCVTVRVLRPGDLLLRLKKSRIRGSDDDLLCGQGAHGDLDHGAANTDHGLQGHDKLEIFLLRIRLALLPHVVECRLGKVQAAFCDPDWLIVLKVQLHRVKFLP